MDLGPAEYLTLDIVQDIAFECCIDQKCSRFIQDRFRMDLDMAEKARFSDKLLVDPRINFEDLVKDQNGNYII